MQRLSEGRHRVVIEGVKPEIDGGRFPAKRVVGERMRVEADIFADGHDSLSGVLRYRKVEHSKWTEVVLQPLVNDRWRGEFELNETGTYQYTLEGWVDPFKSWREGLAKKIAAGQDVSLEKLAGAKLVENAAKPATGKEQRLLAQFVATLRSDDAESNETALSEELATLMEKFSPRSWPVTYEKILSVEVDRTKAGFSAWYEIFPRSCADGAGRHGSFRDCEARLPYVASMGFDVLYLPPIHPIGRSHRKGKNGAVHAEDHDPGSPWAIGSSEGGHKSIHPALGTLADFQSLVKKAREYNIEIALDLAYQCSPDHPYVTEHPEWFRRRPDGTVQYAENPPKKYEDIYPFDFETPHWRELWEELKSIVDYWIEQGVRIFRVDNPHTKPFAFWEWMIGEIKQRHPEVIFLSEAFTRPKIMYRLAKLGFTHSYTYFAWRNTKQELTEYFTELTQSEAREYFRPHLWPNTPDILTEAFQTGGRPTFIARLVLAATLAGNYGIYGPAYELCENRALVPGKEEDLDAEKYEIKR